jgi:hypothetical protein
LFFFFFFFLPAIISAGGAVCVYLTWGIFGVECVSLCVRVCVLAFPYKRRSSPRGKDGWLAGWLAGGDGRTKEDVHVKFHPRLFPRGLPKLPKLRHPIALLRRQHSSACLVTTFCFLTCCSCDIQTYPRPHISRGKPRRFCASACKRPSHYHSKERS